MANKEKNELEKRNQAFLIYQDENGIARVNVRFEGEDVWLTVEQMMELSEHPSVQAQSQHPHPAFRPTAETQRALESRRLIKEYFAANKAI